MSRFAIVLGLLASTGCTVHMIDHDSRTPSPPVQYVVVEQDTRESLPATHRQRPPRARPSAPPQASPRVAETPQRASSTPEARKASTSVPRKPSTRSPREPSTQAPRKARTEVTQQNARAQPKRRLSPYELMRSDHTANAARGEDAKGAKQASLSKKASRAQPVEGSGR
mgnify:CR=1 FL=1